MKEVLKSEQIDLEKLTPKGKIIEAIKSNEPKQFFLMLEKINDELTGKESSHFLPNNVKEIEDNIEIFLNNIHNKKDSVLTVYLGDDFSRLNLDFDSHDKVFNIYLTNELKGAREKWDELNKKSEE